MKSDTLFLINNATAATAATVGTLKII